MTRSPQYSDVLLHIDGHWRPAADGRRIEVENPADHSVAGHVSHAGPADLEAATTAAQRAFHDWKAVAAFDRARLMRQAAQLLRDRAERIATLMTIEQGKPRAEARAEVMAGADIIDWFAEEARRSYGRIVPAWLPGVA